MRRLSATRIDLAEHCLGFLSLDWAEQDGYALRLGKAFHSAVEIYPHAPRWDVIVAENRLTPKAASSVKGRYVGWRSWADAEPGAEDWRHELAVGLDLTTMQARKLEVDRDGKPEATDPWVLATKIDALNMADAHQYEWKTGRFVEPPERNTQTLVAALAVNTMRGIDRSDVTIVKLRDDGPPMVMRGRYDVFDLDLQADRLVRLGERIKAGETVQHAGPHCEALYCPARHGCPAFQLAPKRAEQGAAWITREAKVFG